MSDIQDEAYTEACAEIERLKEYVAQADKALFEFGKHAGEIAKAKDAEIERWKLQHEEMLLKHAKEQEVCLSALDAAMKEIEQLRNEIIVLQRNELYLQELGIRAADALEEEFGPGNTDLMTRDPWVLIDELRKAAE